MGAFNPDIARKIVKDKETGEYRPCAMCGRKDIRPDAAHIIDKDEWMENSAQDMDRQVNGIPLCPNCHRVFDERLKPVLYQALTEYGADGLPEGWKKSNKKSEK